MAEFPWADELPTPAYVYDLDRVAEAYGTLRAALPHPSRLYYSLKANPHPAVVGRLRALGCAAEVCSPGELAAAGAAGVPATDVLYTGPAKRDDDVAEAVKGGVEWFSVDSPTGLDQVDRAAAAQGCRARCLLRVNDRIPVSGQGLTMTGVASQFGADAEWIEARPDLFGSRPAAALAGFHLYMGSNLDGVDALVTQFGTALATARRLADVLGTEPELVNLGGGFGAPFARAGQLPSLSGLAPRVAELLDGTFPGWRQGRPVVAFESGRFLTATAGWLLARVLDVKRSHGTPVVVLESGINHLGGMAGLRRLPPLVPDVQAAGDRAELTGALLAGPLCTPLDTWARAATLREVCPGDVVVVPNVGAYGLYASLLAFLGHPAPAEAIVQSGQIREVTRLEFVRRPIGREQVV